MLVNPSGMLKPALRNWSATVAPMSVVVVPFWTTTRMPSSALASTPRKMFSVGSASFVFIRTTEAPPLFAPTTGSEYVSRLSGLKSLNRFPMSMRSAGVTVGSRCSAEVLASIRSLSTAGLRAPLSIARRITRRMNSC